MFGKDYKETEKKTYYYDSNGRVVQEVTSEPTACTLLKAAGFLVLIGVAGAAGYVLRDVINVSGDGESCSDGGEGGAE